MSTHSLSYDSVGPKHSGSVTIYGPTYDVPDWSTAASTAVAGPSTGTQPAAVTFSWRIEEGLATLSVPEFMFTGGGAALTFAAIAQLPVPLATSWSVINTIESGQYKAGSIVVGTDKTIKIQYGAEDAQVTFVDGLVYTINPTVFKYRIA